MAITTGGGIVYDQSQQLLDQAKTFASSLQNMAQIREEKKKNALKLTQDSLTMLQDMANVAGLPLQMFISTPQGAQLLGQAFEAYSVGTGRKFTGNEATQMTNSMVEYLSKPENYTKATWAEWAGKKGTMYDYSAAGEEAKPPTTEQPTVTKPTSGYAGGTLGQRGTGPVTERGGVVGQPGAEIGDFGTPLPGPIGQPSQSGTGTGQYEGQPAVGTPTGSGATGQTVEIPVETLQTLLSAVQGQVGGGQSGPVQGTAPQPNAQDVLRQRLLQAQAQPQGQGGPSTLRDALPLAQAGLPSYTPAYGVGDRGGPTQQAGGGGQGMSPEAIASQGAAMREYLNVLNRSLGRVAYNTEGLTDEQVYQQFGGLFEKTTGSEQAPAQAARPAAATTGTPMVRPTMSGQPTEGLTFIYGEQKEGSPKAEFGSRSYQSDSAMTAQVASTIREWGVANRYDFGGYSDIDLVNWASKARNPATNSSILSDALDYRALQIEQGQGPISSAGSELEAARRMGLRVAQGGGSDKGMTLGGVAPSWKPLLGATKKKTIEEVWEAYPSVKEEYDAAIKRGETPDQAVRSARQQFYKLGAESGLVISPDGTAIDMATGTVVGGAGEKDGKITLTDVVAVADKEKPATTQVPQKAAEATKSNLEKAKSMNAYYGKTSLEYTGPVVTDDEAVGMFERMRDSIGAPTKSFREKSEAFRAAQIAGNWINTQWNQWDVKQRAQFIDKINEEVMNMDPALAYFAYGKDFSNQQLVRMQAVTDAMAAQGEYAGKMGTAAMESLKELNMKVTDFMTDIATAAEKDNKTVSEYLIENPLVMDSLVELRALANAFAKSGNFDFVLPELTTITEKYGLFNWGSREQVTSGASKPKMTSGEFSDTITKEKEAIKAELQAKYGGGK